MSRPSWSVPSGWMKLHLSPKNIGGRNFSFTLILVAERLRHLRQDDRGREDDDEDGEADPEAGVAHGIGQDARADGAPVFSRALRERRC